MKYIKKFELAKYQVEIDNQLAIGVHRNDINLVKNAIKAGANPNTLDTANTHLLFVAILNDNVKIVKKLLKAGADPNCQDTVGDTPLIYATSFSPKRHGDIIIEELIKYNADWSIRNHSDFDFFDFFHLDSEDYKKFLIQKYPEKYKEYQIKKAAQKYNM